jgi:ABC-2 type transport system ATP-binding protein
MLAGLPGIVQVRPEGGMDRYVLEAEADLRPQVAARIAQGGGELLSLGIRQASLESVYTRYFEEAAHAA